MSEVIKIWHVKTGEVETIDLASYEDYAKKGWVTDFRDGIGGLAERKRERDDNWGINPDPDDSGFAEWSRGRK